MATVHGILSVQLKDNLGVVASHDLFVQSSDATTLAQVVTDAQAYFALLDPLTDAMGIQARFLLLFPSTGLKTSVTVDDPVENTGLFTFSQVSSPYKFSIDIPSFAEAKIAGSKINLADSAVVAWYTWVHANGTHLQVETKARNAIDTFLRSKLSTRKHRNSLAHVSIAEP